jgi:hypothetical protein
MASQLAQQKSSANLDTLLKPGTFSMVDFFAGVLHSPPKPAGFLISTDRAAPGSPNREAEIMTNYLINASVARNEVLREFAALTRHTPASLSGKFGLSMREDGDDATIHASFGGKRMASKTFPRDVLSKSLDEFAAEIAKPLAKELLESVDRGRA